MSSTAPSSATSGAAAASTPSSPSNSSALHAAVSDGNGGGSGGGDDDGDGDRGNVAEPARPPSPTAQRSSRQQVPLSPAQVRDIVRLMQCPICSGRLQEPVTLPCGRTLCRKCLPSSHLRANISYPATANRLLGFHCPFAGCEKEHAIGDCAVDVTLNKALGTAHAELEKLFSNGWASQGQTIAEAGSPRDSAHVLSSPVGENTATSLRDGLLPTMYLMTERGELDYDADMSQAPHDLGDYYSLDAKAIGAVKHVVRAEMDCHICYALYFDPVTTPCGHTFCRSCLQRVLDHARLCPVCRRELTIQPLVYRQASPSNELITRITTAFWADLVEARKQMVAAEAVHHGNTDYDIAVFVCTLSFPAMPTFLHIFEPRYRLMIRRALQGDRTFGMVLYQPGSPLSLGTTLQIVNVEFFLDGRSLVETVGVSRFRILSRGILDDYTVARIERINDISVAEEEELEASETRSRAVVGANHVPMGGSGDSLDRTATAPSLRFPTRLEDIEHCPTSELMAFAVDFVRRMQDESVRWLTTRMRDIYGECPQDPVLFPWWLASVLPVRDLEKYRLLGSTSVRERLKICCRWIMEWEQRP